MKSKRQEKILELIKTYDIDTQEELSRLLQENGFRTTQGTISRDIRELKITKVTGQNGRPKYAPLLRDDIHVSDKLKRVLSEGILHMESAQNILVIKTVTGMAMACATAIDSISVPGILGCIAGDDTIFCAIKDNSMVKDAIDEINHIVKQG